MRATASEDIEVRRLLVYDGKGHLSPDAVRLIWKVRRRIPVQNQGQLR
jgi:hypothetical protein